MGRKLVRCASCESTAIRGLLDDEDTIVLVCANCDRKIGTAGPPAARGRRQHHQSKAAMESGRYVTGELVSEATAAIVRARFDQLAKLKR